MYCIRDVSILSSGFRSPEADTVPPVMIVKYHISLVVYYWPSIFLATVQITIRFQFSLQVTGNDKILSASHRKKRDGNGPKRD